MGIWDTVKKYGGTVLGGLASGGPVGAAIGYGVGKLVDEIPESWKNTITGDPKVQLDPNAGQLRDADLIRQQAAQGMAGLGQRTAPRAGQTALNMADQSAARAQSQDLANRLAAQAQGQTAGAGELAVQRQVSRALAAQTAAARMGRGAAAPLAARTAARNMADIGLAGAGQAQQAAMTDQAQANQLLAGVLGQTRGQDIDVASQQAALQQQTNLANMSAELQARGMDDQTRLAYMAQLTGLSQAEVQAYLAAKQLEIAQRNPGILPDLLKIGGQAASAAAMASDRSLKTDVKRADDDADVLLDSLRAYRYKYKDDRLGKGERLGIMAQDLERSDLGRSAVRDTEIGKVVDVPTALGIALGALGRINTRLRRVEGKE